MSILFQSDMTGIANGTNFATQFAAYWSLVSGEAKIYNESLRNGQYGGMLQWAGSEIGIVRATHMQITMNAAGNGLLSSYPMFVGVDANNLRLLHSSGAWKVFKGFTTVIQVADTEAYAVRDILFWVEPLGGSDYRVHLSIDGVDTTADVNDSTWTTSTPYRFGTLGSTDWAYFDDIKIATDIADISTAEPDAIEGDISFSMPMPSLEASGAYIAPVVGQLGITPQLPTVAAEGHVLTPIVGSISISAPFPSVSMSGSYVPPEEIDPDTVYGSIAFMAPFPSVEISGSVIAPVVGSVSASPSSPALSLSGESLQPILGSVSVDAPAPELEASGTTPSVIYGDMSLDIDWLPIFALAGYVIDDSEPSGAAKSAYSGIAAGALRTIKSKGMAMTLRVVSEGEYIPGSGTPAQTTTDYTVYGVLTNYKGGQVDGTLVQVGDMQVIVGGPLSPRPETGNLLHISGELWGIVAVQRVAPDGTDIIYKVQIRKG